MKDLKEFLIRYSGAIIGGLVALILLILKIHIILLWIVVIVIGVFIGNYIQRNKEFVKDKLKYFVDKMWKSKSFTFDILLSERILKWTELR